MLIRMRPLLTLRVNTINVPCVNELSHSVTFFNNVVNKLPKKVVDTSKVRLP